MFVKLCTNGMDCAINKETRIQERNQFETLLRVIG